MSSTRCLIVGGGQAALSAASKLRELDSETTIGILSAETVLPYQRPPLSKAYLSGEMPLDRLMLRPDDWYREHRIDIALGCEVKSIDPPRCLVTLNNGKSHSYDRLLLATGSTPRRLPDEVGGNLPGVFVLRSSQNSDSIRPYLKSGNRLVVIGGGYIGLEVAAVASKVGLKVTIVEVADRILQRVAAPETSEYFRVLHEKNGVTFLEKSSFKKIMSGGNDDLIVEMKDGDDLSADLVLVGIGILPNVGLATNAGLTISNGVEVDQYCRSSDQHIFAAGDCASFEWGSSRIRLESVPNSIHQAEVAAVNMLGGTLAYQAAPWFWSDQYDVKLQIAGLNIGYTNTVVRPGKREGGQSVWYYKGEQLLAVDAINDAPAFMMARKIIEAGKNVPSDVAADPATNLKEWI